MRRWTGASLFLLAAVAAAPPLAAQEPAATAEIDSLLEEGSFTAAREAVLRLWAERGESLRGEARARALFLRGLLAVDLDAAETDFIRMVVEHPSSPHTDAAMLRLALLHLQRDDAAEALRMLDRLAAGYPQSALLPTAAEWRRRIAAQVAPSPPASDPAVTPPTAPGGWAVQVAALRNREAARALAAELNRRGFAAEARPAGADGLTRVRVGGFATAAAAQEASRRVREAGYEAVVVRDAG